MEKYYKLGATYPATKAASLARGSKKYDSDRYTPINEG